LVRAAIDAIEAMRVKIGLAKKASLVVDTPRVRILGTA